MKTITALLVLGLFGLVVVASFVPPNCPVICTSEWRPVCGINPEGQKRSFDTECVIALTNCDLPDSKHFTLLSQGLCHRVGRIQSANLTNTFHPNRKVKT